MKVNGFYCAWVWVDASHKSTVCIVYALDAGCGMEITVSLKFTYMSDFGEMQERKVQKKRKLNDKFIGGSRILHALAVLHAPWQPKSDGQPESVGMKRYIIQRHSDMDIIFFRIVVFDLLLRSSSSHYIYLCHNITQRPIIVVNAAHLHIKAFVNWMTIRFWLSTSFARGSLKIFKRCMILCVCVSTFHVSFYFYHSVFSFTCHTRGYTQNGNQVIHYGTDQLSWYISISHFERDTTVVCVCNMHTHLFHRRTLEMNEFLMRMGMNICDRISI